MATSFLNKAGLTSLWAKIKATFALKSEIPDSTSDLTNDSGFIDSARFDINLTSDWDDQTETTTYTTDKTYQQITAAIAAGKIPQVDLYGSLFLFKDYVNIEGHGQYIFERVNSIIDYGTNEFAVEFRTVSVSDANHWTMNEDSRYISQSDWNQNDSTAADYVKNRVCYTGDPVMTEIFSGTVASGEMYFELSWNNGYLYFDSLEDGKEIVLTIDEVTYNETLTWVQEENSTYGYYWCGNKSLLGGDGEDTGESYVIQIDGTFVSAVFKEVFDHDATVTISTAIPEIHTLDDKYLNGALLKRGTGYMSVILNGEGGGLVASGDCSVAEGVSTTASGSSSHAEGENTTSSGGQSHSEGGYTTASGSRSHSEGTQTIASGFSSHSEGLWTVASSDESHSEGSYTSATGKGSHSEGGSRYNSSAFNSNLYFNLSGDANATTYTVNNATPAMHSLVGFWIGNARVISETVGSSSGRINNITLDKTLSSTAITSENYQIRSNGTSASGENSHAEGLLTSATAFASHAEGLGTHANHRSQHVFGEWNNRDSSTAAVTARGNYVEIVGNGTYDAHSNARTLDWSGNEVLAGKLTVGAAPTANMDVATKKYVDDAVAGSGSAVTYTLSITNNVITLTGSDGSTSTVTLPVYTGGVSS